MGKLFKHNPPNDQVTFTNPTSSEPVQGRILEEVWAIEPECFGAEAPHSDGWREPAFVVQLIEWQPDNFRSVRFTYYLRPEGGGPHSWYFGGQYAPSMGLEEYVSLMDKLKNKDWQPSSK